MYLQSHIYKNIPVSVDFITTWNQGVFLCSPCIWNVSIFPLSYKRMIISFDLFAHEPWSLLNSLDVQYGMSCCETFRSIQLFLALVMFSCSRLELPPMWIQYYLHAVTRPLYTGWFRWKYKYFERSFWEKGLYEHYLIPNGDEIRAFWIYTHKSIANGSKKEKLLTVNFIVILM